MEIGYSTVQEQSQIMSQNQIQSLQILAMDNMELNEYLQNEYCLLYTSDAADE